MSLDIIASSQLAPYEDEEEIQLMDTDGTNLQLDEQSELIHTTTNVVNKEEENDDDDDDKTEKEEEEEEEKPPLLLVIEKLKVYIRDGPKSHHVETISTDDKYYDLPTIDQLTPIDLTEEIVKEVWQSLNLTEEDFRSSSSSSGGTSRPESLYVRGVNNMSTQEILNCFEEFKPIGIEWISDQSCNVFWHEALSPIRLLATVSKPGPAIAHPRPVNFDHTMRLSKRKRSSPTNTEGNSADIALPLGAWREANFELADKPDSPIKLYLRYTTLDDRKSRGAENQSDYYRQHGNPNYNNMTGLISRSKKRALNAMKSNHYRDFTVVKSNDSTSVSSIVEEASVAPEDNTTDANVKFTVVLPPKKTASSKEDEVDDDEEGGHRSKRHRRRRSGDDDDAEDDRRHKEKTHFTVNIDPESKRTKSKLNETSPSNKDGDDEVTPVTDARQILERKRRNRQ